MKWPGFQEIRKTSVLIDNITHIWPSVKERTKFVKHIKSSHEIVSNVALYAFRRIMPSQKGTVISSKALCVYTK